MIDKDQWDLEGAAKQIRQKQFCLAESYPCFELWLLLHHMQVNELRGLAGKTSSGRCKPVTDVLKSQDPPYQKGKVTNKCYFNEEKTNQAIAKAKQLDYAGSNRPLRSFGTRVYELIESIRRSST